MKEIQIRYAGTEDVRTLSRLGADTFWETYQTESLLEQKYIRAHIASTFDAGQIGSEVGKENIIYLLAETGDEQAGYVRLLLESSRDEISGEKPIELSRIYLRKKFWGKKLGPYLLQRCFEEALKNFCDVIWLSVWQHNERAIAFYKKHGFYEVGSHVFDLASSPQTDLIMQKELKS